MSQVISLSCLSVQEFFRNCNWQGQPLELYQEPIQPPELDNKILTQQSIVLNNQPKNWQCLSVKEFFNHSNWQGQPPELEFYQESVQQQTNWQCLSVKAFFQNCNWQGQPPKTDNRSPVDPSSPLTLRVEDFLRFITWESQPKIASLPNELTILEETSSGVKETTLENLSELF